MFVSSGFEHCVANMFMVPLGIVIQSTAPEAFWHAIGANPAQYADLNISQFVTANLIPVTLGNIVGGAILVGLTNWPIYRRPELKASNSHAITTTSITTSIKDLAMNSPIQAKDIMISNTAILRADMPTELAIDLLTERQIQGAPVVDVNGRLVGFLSIHDVMVDLWCQDYIPTKNQKVVDIMSRDVVAIDAKESLLNIVEFLCIDKEQLYPSSSAGIATSMSMLSLEERAKAMNISAPQILPVLENGVFIGTVSRMETVKALRSIYGEKMNVVETESALESA
jgi:predicted transcriptional regulator